MTAHEVAAPDLRPRQASSQWEAGALRGLLAAPPVLLVAAAGVALVVVAGEGIGLVAGIALLALAALGCAGFVVVQPNESKVLVLLGRYVGTVTADGWWWVNPFTLPWRETISLRVRNFQSERIKVNDAGGSPIEIAAVIVWRVEDTAKAVFDVEDEAMLRRQQASAIVAARQTIVSGAVGLVDMALRQIGDREIVELDDERRAAMVSNLMVVLTGDRAPSPVINTGSLYT